MSGLYGYLWSSTIRFFLCGFLLSSVPIRGGHLLSCTRTIQVHSHQMAEALGPAAYVHEGFWMNWTKGGKQGLTLTLCPDKANLFLSALTLFVAMSGGQLWTIVRFTLHQTRAFSRPESMLHSQQQFVLRNIPTDLATARLLASLTWTWRNKDKKPFLASAVLLSIAVVHAILFMAAGTLSSRLVTANQTVLSRSPYCGVFNTTYLEIAGQGFNVNTAEAFQQSIEFIAKVKHDIQLSLEYARECYMLPPAYYMSSSCNTFQKAHLNFTTHNGTCPFESNVCSDSLETIVFDTGPVDSHDDLGINAIQEDRVTYQRVTNCTVLNDTTYTTKWVDQEDTPGKKNAFAYYGKSLRKSTNWTYEYSNFADFYTNDTAITTTSYQVDCQRAVSKFSDPGGSTFQPIPELEQLNADILLIFLSYTGKYIAQVDDPWFSAHVKSFAENASAAILQTIYGRDRPINTLGCTEQHQICTGSRSCTGLLGFNDLQDAISTRLSLLTPNQKTTIDRIISSVSISSIKTVVDGLATGSTPLLAIASTATDSHTLSLGLGPDQWQVEAGFWHSVAMAHLQRSIVEFGTGQIAAQTKYILPPATDSEKWICENLLIRGTEFQSFNVVALALITCFGSLIVFLSFTIESLASCAQSRSKSGLKRIKIWDHHDMLNPAFGDTASRQLLPSPQVSFIASTEQQEIYCKCADVELTSYSYPGYDLYGESSKTETKLHGEGCDIEGCSNNTPDGSWHNAGMGPPARWCRSCYAWYQMYKGTHKAHPSKRSFQHEPDSVTSEVDGGQPRACATCGVIEPLIWHVARLGDGWWCDKCFRWYLTYMESSMVQSQGGWI